MHTLSQFAYDSYVTKDSQIPPLTIKKERVEEQYKAMNELTC